MSEIRKQNLQILAASFKTQRAFADALDATPGYVSQLLIGVGSFGEKVARKIEGLLDIPEGWLDVLHESETVLSEEPEKNDTLDLTKLTAENRLLVEIMYINLLKGQADTQPEPKQQPQSQDARKRLEFSAMLEKTCDK